MKNDFIFIEKMEVPCRIGTTPQERAFPQIIEITLHIEASLKKAGTSDHLTDTIDYAKIIEDIRTMASAQEFTLAERLAELAAALVLKHPKAKSAQVQIKKKVFAGIESVGISVYRKKRRP